MDAELAGNHEDNCDARDTHTPKHCEHTARN